MSLSVNFLLLPPESYTQLRLPDGIVFLLETISLLFNFRKANYRFRTGEHVYNVIGTAKCNPRYDSWKEFWSESTNNKWPKECRIWYCTNPATVGAHVEIPGKIEYHILPMCNKCNKASANKKMRVNSKSLAVPVLEEDTTGTGNCWRE